MEGEWKTRSTEERSGRMNDLEDNQLVAIV